MTRRCLPGAEALVAAAIGLMMNGVGWPALAQNQQTWWPPLAQETTSLTWTDIDAAGFGPDDSLSRLALRRQATPGAKGYWTTHLRALYSTPQDLPGVDGETIRTSEVYVAMLLDCERGRWLLAGAYGAAATEGAALLAPLAHAGLEATEVALDRVTRLACRTARTAQGETAPAGAVFVELPMP
jgi:hypothetical protein